jgi:flagellar basal-body rod modification protein FlgD
MATVNATQASGLPAVLTTGTSTAAAPHSAAAEKTQFLKLLVAQLKGQNPLDPMDGTQFISQLAQFSSVEELINIRTLLEGFSNNSTGGKEGSSGTDANPFEGA